jgi:hypothetical protein
VYPAGGAAHSPFRAGGGLVGEGSKRFFFEKKKQKTFIHLLPE